MPGEREMKKAFDAATTPEARRLFADFLEGIGKMAEDAGFDVSAERVAGRLNVARPMETGLDAVTSVHPGGETACDVEDVFGRKAAEAASCAFDIDPDDADPDEWVDYRITCAYGMMEDGEIGLIVYGTEVDVVGARRDAIEIAPYAISAENRESERIFAFASSGQFPDAEPAEAAGLMIESVKAQLHAREPQPRMTPRM